MVFFALLNDLHAVVAFVEDLAGHSLLPLMDVNHDACGLKHRDDAIAVHQDVL